VLGVFVAYVKLGDLVKIELETGVYALLALTVVIVWADGALGSGSDLGRIRHRPRPGFITRCICHGTGTNPSSRVRNLQPWSSCLTGMGGLPSLRLGAAFPKAGKPASDLGVGDWCRGVLCSRERPIRYSP